MHDHQEAHLDQLPCLYCQPHDYVRMVQHMIERCLLLQMSREDCVKALEKHAGIQPIITLTVWKELRKENKGFFRAYFKSISPTSTTSLVLHNDPESDQNKQGEAGYSEDDA